MRAYVLFALLLAPQLISAKSVRDDGLELSVIHVNDFHARFEEVSQQAGTCKEESTDCIGGFSRLYEQIVEIQSQTDHSILLNAGDNFQGTIWYTFFKWNVTQYFLNKLPFDAIVLGNHEFDDGIDGVVPFIKSLNAPVVVSNIDDSEEPDMQGIYTKSTVIERFGKKIGIVGVITSLCAQISNTEKLKFFKESESVNREAERLVDEEGVFTVIVLSHSGYDVDQVIAQNASSKIGLIVGGHSHSFLYTGDSPPGPDTPVGPYPTIVDRKDGKKVLVTQASCYTKYLGNISVVYDSDGEIVSWNGAPIFLDTPLPQNDKINEELEPWAESVDVVGKEVLGSTLVTLNEDNCRYGECLLGDFVTDAMVFEYSTPEDENSWTYASIAIMNAGGIRTSLERGNITYNDLVTAQPFGNTVDVSDIEGKYIKGMLEFAASEEYYFGRAYASINLLQVSGIQVVFNLSKPEGERAQSIKVLCNTCLIPIYEDLNQDKTYKIITPSFLTGGGDGFTVISENLQNTKVGRVDIDVFKQYLSAKSPIIQKVEGRIEVIGVENVELRNLG